MEESSPEYDVPIPACSHSASKEDPDTLSMPECSVGLSTGDDGLAALACADVAYA